MRSAVLPALYRFGKFLPYALFGIIVCYIVSKLWTLNFLFSKGESLFTASFLREHLAQLAFIFLLCPINWVLEAAKWQVASQPFSRISLFDALRAVLSGQALNLIFPGSLGHYAGRIAYTENKSLERVAAVFVCQAWQMGITFAMSLVGLWYWGPTVLPFGNWTFILVAVSILMGVFLVVVIVQQLHIGWLHKINQGFRELSTRQFFKIGLLSLVRYAVFTSQFVWMLQIAGAKMDWCELALAISLVFMAKSLMPSIHFMSDLGLREFCALLFLPAIGICEEVVLFASLFIWLINILLPSLMGAFMVLHIKLIRAWQ